jgi:hypothetical protein
MCPKNRLYALPLLQIIFFQCKVNTAGANGCLLCTIIYFRFLGFTVREETSSRRELGPKLAWRELGQLVYLQRIMEDKMKINGRYRKIVEDGVRIKASR